MCKYHKIEQSSAPATGSHVNNIKIAYSNTSMCYPNATHNIHLFGIQIFKLCGINAEFNYTASRIELQCLRWQMAGSIHLNSSQTVDEWNDLTTFCTKHMRL